MLETKLRNFVSIRNKSPHQTNLQFHFDLESAGLRIADIGEPEVLGDSLGYRWTIRDGHRTIFLEERFGRMSIEIRENDGPNG